MPLIESAHPSPNSADRGFFGSRPFSRANAALEEQGAGDRLEAAITGQGPEPVSAGPTISASACRTSTATCAAPGRSRGLAARQAAHSPDRLAGMARPAAPAPAPATAPAGGSAPVRQAANSTPTAYTSAAGVATPPAASSGA